MKTLDQYKAAIRECWIPVSQMLPEPDETVLIDGQSSRGLIDVPQCAVLGYITDGGIWYLVHGEYDSFEPAQTVRHWMPIVASPGNGENS